MINLILVYYLFGTTCAILFLLSNLPIAYLLHKYVKKRYYTAKYDDSNSNIHLKYPSFRRMENQPPSLARIYFGFISYVYLKFAGCVIVLLICYIRMKLILKGRKPQDLFTTPDFKIIRGIGSWTGKWLCNIFGIINPKHHLMKEKVTEVYKKYLGSSFDYDKAFADNKYATVISNHIGWIDIFYLAYLTNSAFVAKASVRKAPIVGPICELINTVFIDRGGDKEARDKAVKAIEARQKLAMEDESALKVAIFAEGTGTNNTGLIKFKKGPFGSLFPVRPYVILVNGNGSIGNPKERKTDELSLGAGVMSTNTHVFLSMCYLYFDDFNVIELPTFTPNDYLYENFKNLGNTKVDIYNEAVRKAMAEISGLELHDEESYEKKLDYLCHVKGRTIKST